MNAGIIARRYATVLLDFASENKELERVYSDAKLICDTLAGQETANALLSSPLRKPSEKKAFLQNLFSKYVCSSMLKFIAFVVDKHRTELICEILRVFRSLYRKKLEIKSARITTATPLTDKNQKDFTSIIEKKTNGKVEAEFTTDESIIGGIIIALDGKQLDASITRQLKDIERGLTA